MKVPPLEKRKIIKHQNFSVLFTYTMVLISPELSFISSHPNLRMPTAYTLAFQLGRKDMLSCPLGDSDEYLNQNKKVAPPKREALRWGRDM